MVAKKIIENTVSRQVLLEFEVLFPNEQKLSPEEYLMGGSREVILKVATFLLCFKHHDSKFADNRELMKTFFGAENNAFANDIYSKIQVLEKKHPVRLINTYTSLTLFECYFNKIEGEVKQTTSEFEINVFKAYLALNSEFTSKQELASTSTKGLDAELELPMFAFCSSYPYSDKENYDIKVIWTTQAIKAILFFKFLEANPKTQTLLIAFLNHFKCQSWQQYLKKLLPLTFSAINNETQTGIIVQPGDTFEGDCEFVEKLIVTQEDELNEYDFLTLRSKPFYKIKDGEYRIIFKLFVVEKIFKGIYFMLRSENERLPKEQQIKELKSIYGGQFSEKTLLYEILQSIYPDKCKSFSGEALDKMKIDGAPDYYIRKGNDILLFECKDFLINASAKMSFDFSVYENEFEKKLYFTDDDGKEKNKAVMQLIEVVRKLLINGFSADKNYNYRDVSIYPILLVHDHQFDTVGFNVLINYWFQAELELLREEGFFVNRVKPIVVINIDSLIHHQVGLKESISLQVVLKKYLEHIHINPLIKVPQHELESYIMSKYLPFSIFIDSFFSKNNLTKQPVLLEAIVPELFK